MSQGGDFDDQPVIPSPSSLAALQFRDDDGIPAGTCERCGCIQGRRKHRDAEVCISHLRGLLAAKSFRDERKRRELPRYISG